jgi:hypothetical protein
VLAALGVQLSAATDQPIDLAATLQRVGERVERYFARAQSLVCLETVRLRPFGFSSQDRLGRTVESELRLSWDAADGDGGAPEAAMERQVLRINGSPPRKNDPNDCTTPEQNSTETPALAMLRPSALHEYVFTYKGMGRVDDRPAIQLDYRARAKASVTSSMVEDREDCVSFDVDGGMRGRVWVDAETYDVLRLDQGLTGWVDIPLPRTIWRRSDRRSWTMERMDVSTRFKPVRFENPDETLVLPVSVTTMTITRGSGTPQLFTVTEYSEYRRFLTGGRIVPNPEN